MFTEQVPPAEQAPLHELKVEPESGAAFSVTVESWKKLKAHCGGQLIPVGALVTVPVPSPEIVTVNG